MERRRVVRVPASSANLGPGFDTFAAALGVHLELEVVETGSFSVITDLELPTDRENLCVRAFELLHPADGFCFRIRSEIPLAGGLGSSAAAIVAGLTAADHLFELDADRRRLATELEGHPDNVAAALLGGFVICTEHDVVRLDPPAELEAVLAIPHERLKTTEARAALPDSVALAAAVHNTAHGALLMVGVAQGDWDLVSRGLSDRLHEPHRAHLYPRSSTLAGQATELGALGATISGAGPSVLFWCHYEQTGHVLAQVREHAQSWASVRRATFEPQGADVRAI